MHPTLLALLLAPAHAVSDAQACQSDPNCAWVVNGSGAGHCLCKLTPLDCPPLQPLPNPDPGGLCTKPGLAAPATWTCTAGDATFTWSGFAWNDGSGTGHVVGGEQIATCTAPRPTPAPESRAALDFLLGQTTRATAAWARAQNFLVDADNALEVCDAYGADLELALEDAKATIAARDDALAVCAADDEADACLFDAARDPALTLADALKLCGKTAHF